MTAPPRRDMDRKPWHHDPACWATVWALAFLTLAAGTTGYLIALVAAASPWIRFSIVLGVLAIAGLVVACGRQR